MSTSIDYTGKGICADCRAEIDVIDGIAMAPGPGIVAYVKLNDEDGAAMGLGLAWPVHACPREPAESGETKGEGRDE